MTLQLELPIYKLEIEQFCMRVEEAFQPDCIILHGSIARGTYTHSSDIDFIVIGKRLPENFFERAYQLNRLRDGTTPIEVVGYTLAEWQSIKVLDSQRGIFLPMLNNASGIVSFMVFSKTDKNVSHQVKKGRHNAS